MNIKEEENMTFTNVSLTMYALYGRAWHNSAQTHNSVIQLSNGEVLAPKGDNLQKKKLTWPCLTCVVPSNSP